MDPPVCSPSWTRIVEENDERTNYQSIMLHLTRRRSRPEILLNLPVN
jgi:hypothetical protein